MSDNIPRCMSEELTRKWHDLAEKRRAHFVDLYDSGRWKHYYSESEFVARMRDTVKLSDRWAELSVAETPEAAE